MLVPLELVLQKHLVDAVDVVVALVDGFQATQHSDEVDEHFEGDLTLRLEALQLLVVLEQLEKLRHVLAGCLLVTFLVRKRGIRTSAEPFFVQVLDDEVDVVGRVLREQFLHPNTNRFAVEAGQPGHDGDGVLGVELRVLGDGVTDGTRVLAVQRAGGVASELGGITEDSFQFAANFAGLWGQYYSSAGGFRHVSPKKVL